jgi:hypothetical protein
LQGGIGGKDETDKIAILLLVIVGPLHMIEQMIFRIDELLLT